MNAQPFPAKFALLTKEKAEPVALLQDFDSFPSSLSHLTRIFQSSQWHLKTRPCSILHSTASFSLDSFLQAYSITNRPKLYLNLLFMYTTSQRHENNATGNKAQFVKHLLT
jgi:hypothetical protein